MRAVRFYRRLKRQQDKKSVLALKALFQNQSYRLPEQAKQDPLIGFKSIYRLLRKRDNNDSFSFLQDSKHLVITGSTGSVETRMRYLESLELRIGCVVSKESLAAKWRSLSFATMFQLIGFALLQAFSCLIQSQQRIQRALLLTELVEAELLAKLIEERCYDWVHDFAQFEIDSNFFYLYAKQRFPDLTYAKYPSPGPLQLHNSILLADILCYNTEYQRQEIDRLDGVMVSDVHQVPPEAYLDYVDEYRGKPMPPEFDLAYYSHGGWLREASGDSDDGLGISAKEEELLKALGNILRRHEHLSIKVFTHPRERKKRSQMFQYYRRLLGELKDQVEIVSDSNLKTTRCFADAKVGVGVYSTILHERQYMGFKTLFVSPVEWFPMKDSVLEVQATHSMKELEVKLLGFLDSSGDSLARD